MLVHPRVGAASRHVGASRGYCPQPPPPPLVVKAAGTFLVCPLRTFPQICGLQCQSSSNSIRNSCSRRRGKESRGLLRQRRAAVQLLSSAAHAVPSPTDVQESVLELELDGAEQQQQRQGFDFASAPRSVSGGEGEGQWLRLGKTTEREEEEESTSSLSSASRLVVELDNLEKSVIGVNAGTPPLLQDAAELRLDNDDESSASAAGEWEGLEEGRSSGNASFSGRDGGTDDPVKDHSTSRQAANKSSKYLNSKQPLSTEELLSSSEGPEPSEASEASELSELKPKDVEYFVPKAGDIVMGVVVSGNEHKLEVDIGAEKLGRILSKDLRPIDMFGPDEFFWEIDDGATSLPEAPLTEIRFLGDGGARSDSSMILPVGSVLSLQVFGVSMGGRPMLTGRSVASRFAWERVRQIHEQDEPIRVQCAWWNSDGLVCKIEGLRALLPWQQFVTKSTKPKSLKEHVGEWRTVMITDVNEAEGKLTLSEKRAWVRVGTLVSGTVKRIFPYGVEVILTGTTLRAMIHISQLSNAHVADIKSVFGVGETVKAVIVKSPIAHRIALSTAHLETSDGLILQDKERVFQEAEEMAAHYRESLPEVESNTLDKEREFFDLVIANEDWLDFEV